MNKFRALKSCFIAASLISVYPLSAYSIDFQSGPVIFDADGKGSNGVTVGAFEWQAGSVLSTSDAEPDASDVPVIPWPPSTTKSIQSVTHGTLDGYTDPDGDPLGDPVGLNVDFEITFVLAFGEVGTSNADVSQILFPGVPGAFGVDTDPKFLNIVTFYYDDNIGDGTKSNALNGTGYNDGEPILEGVVAESVADFKRNGESYATFDQYGLTDDWGISTIEGQGSTQLFVLVTEVDEKFFPDLPRGSIIAFSNNQTVPFQTTNPSRQLFVGSNTFDARLGDTNGVDGPDIELQTDPVNSFTPLVPEFSCRVTGGGNDTSGILIDANGERVGYDNSVAIGGRTTGNKKRYTQWWTMGGQAGANTGKQPQPKGEWEHQNHGDFGEWGFHGGTASAPPGTEIDMIVCSDEFWCKQARPAPTKQIDFAGVGTFHNLPGQGGKVNPQGKDVGKSEGDVFMDLPFDVAARETYHWFEVHIEDLGEPGNIAQAENIGKEICPFGGTGTDAFAGVPPSTAKPPENGVFVDASCDCPDFYRIRIYAGATPAPGDFNEDGSLSDAFVQSLQANKGLEFYEASGYIDGGNFQIHPPTGFDLK